MIILAIDPGKTVGFAWFNYHEDKKEVELIEANQLSWQEFLPYFYKKAKNNGDFEVLYEQYRIRTTTISANLNKELLTVKVIGAIEFICRLFKIKFQNQPAGIGAEFFHRERLEKMDMWIVGKVHARDAIRHGMYHLTFRRE